MFLIFRLNLSLCLGYGVFEDPSNILYVKKNCGPKFPFKHQELKTPISSGNNRSAAGSES